MYKRQNRKGDSLIFKNPYYKRIRGSHMLIISCGYCKTDIAKYQKKGRGNLLNMHVERIIESSFNPISQERNLCCPSCGEKIATRFSDRGQGSGAYRMERSAFNTREANN